MVKLLKTMVNKSFSKIIILISGSGSNLQSIIDNSDNIGVNIQSVISNKADAFGLKRAKNAGIATKVIERKQFATDKDFDYALIRYINTLNPDLIVLAGFMHILTTKFINTFAGQILNIHPALLPKYKGLNTHQRAIDAGDSKAGASVHFVTNELDSGEIILQRSVPIDLDDNAATLAKKVLEQEHILYLEAIQKVLQR